MDEKELNAQDIFDKFSLKVLFYSNNYKYDRICGKINKNIKSTIKDLNNELDNLKPIFDKPVYRLRFKIKINLFFYL